MYERKISLKTLYLLGIICAGLAFLGVGSTYAVFVAEDTISNPISFVSNLSYDGNVIETIEVTVEAGETISTTLNITNNGTSSINYVVWHNNKNDNVHIGLNSGTVSGTLTSGTTSYPVVDIRNKTDESLKLILGISSGTGSVVLSGDMYVVPSEKIHPYLVEYISDLYTPNSTATNNSIVYNLDTTNYLMNDRLGGVETLESGVGNIRYYGTNPNNYVDIGDVYTHDTVVDNFELNSFMLDMISVMYTEINNREACYDFFECSTNYTDIGSVYGMTYTNEAECLLGLKNDYHVSSVDDICGIEEKKAGEQILYRIIGLFEDIELSTGEKEDLVKVVRNDTMGLFARDLTGTSEEDYTYDNNWHDATLNNILNNGYYNRISVNHLYFDFWYDDTMSVITDFKIIGLSSNVHNKIEAVKWNLGGWNEATVYPNVIYVYERGNEKCSNCTYETTWPGKIALMYPSDYGYATDFNKCMDINLFDYDNSECRNNNWLCNGGRDMSEWLLTPGITEQNAWATYFGSVVINNGTEWGQNMRPTFYLTSDVSKMSGSGTKTYPYVVR